ncbi:DUF1819 family protein [Parasphingorhabdus flavimaris]|uniref:DUF1819 family protein n=1 Tax=Parasphingorhabdus flavimaris TaxID=266812 RepID=A0ABX2N6R5_9SPHN|nr:DUF1819 family protein [Parasphingorhabdus flavimaris]NVD29421.1 DUF1819 family protein [Parasphingorhabdus flavimaris]
MSFGTGGLFLNESVAIAGLYQELNDWTEVKKVAGQQGVIPFKKQSSVSRSVREIANRLSALNSDEIDLLCSGSYHDQVSVLWLALCRAYRFIGEFAVELLSERYLSFRTHVTYDDYDAFYAGKAEWEPELEAISTSTREKLRQILFRLMRETGILSQDDHICRAMLSPRFANLVTRTDPQELRYFPGADIGSQGPV